jgi:putative ABC transport system permease protein
MLLKDFLFAARSLRKSPAFFLTSVVTIALGIGASTAIFSVVSAVLIRPLPYTDPERLAIIWGDLRVRNVTDWPFSGPDFDDLRRNSTLFDAISGVNTGRATVPAENGDAEMIRTGNVTPNFLSLMGARVAYGRDFTDADATPPTPGTPVPAIAILSNHYWRRRFGADPGVIGRSVDFGLNGKAQIVGVLQPGFELLFPPTAGLERNPDVWVAMRANFATGNRNNVFVRVVGRVKPGVSFAQAQSQVDALAAELRERLPINKTSGLYFRVEPMHRNVVASVRPSLVALMGAVIFLLLIACANVANLLLLRAAARGRERAVRAALGGNQWDLVRQMMAETLLLAGTGALLGLGLARAGIDLLISLGPKNLPRLDHVAVDLPVLGFTAAAALAAAALFGIAPALRASRPDIMDVLRTTGRTAGLGSGQWMRNFVVVTEVALSFVLLVGSGLMIRTFVALQRVDPGFDPRGVLTFLTPILARTPQQAAAISQDLRQRLASIPGVSAVSAATSIPLDGVTPLARWGTEEALTDPNRFKQGNAIAVLPGYFELMRTKLLDGRTFTEADNRPDAKLVIIDDLLAAKAYPNQRAVGKRLLSRVITPEAEWYEIVGVVRHQRHDTLAADGKEGMFFTDGYFGHGSAGVWTVRTEGDPNRLIPMVRAEIAKFDKRLPVSEARTLESFVEGSQAQTQFALILIGIFAGIAALLAAVGLYGVLSDAVRQRTAEIGLRMALGAAPGSIFQLVVGHGLRLSAAGVAVGVIAAVSLTRIMSTMLVGVKAQDPATFSAIAVLFFAIAATACWIPARRAAGMDPTTALREE